MGARMECSNFSFLEKSNKDRPLLMTTRRIITSSITQGFQCPANCPGALHIWTDRSRSFDALICYECEASWSVDESTNLNEQYFESNLERGLERALLDRHDLIRILDHRLFNTDESDFPELVEQAWNRRIQILGADSNQNSSIISMGRVIGRKGEHWVHLLYNPYTDQITDLQPVRH